MSVSVMLVRPLLEALDSASLRREDFLREACFDAARLDDDDGRLTLEEYERLQTLAVERTGDPALGLHMGERASLAAFDVVGHLLAHAKTMREGIAVFLRFHHILSDCPDSTLHENGELATLEYEFPKGSPHCNRLRAEFGVTVLLWMGRHYVGPREFARRVLFQHEEPPYREEYTRLFHGVEHFGQPFTGVEFERRLLDREQLHKNAELYQVLESQAERKSERIERAHGYRDRLREFLVNHTPGERPDMETVARKFGMSVRSLRRRLTEEGVTYVGLAEEAMATIAKRMLDDPEMTIQDAAYAVGFSDPSAFHRAFKRWTGMTPKRYRESSDSER